MVSPTPTLIELSTAIRDNVQIIEESLEKQGIPPLSFSVDTPPRFPVGQEQPEVREARRKAMEAAKAVHDLLWGPQDRMLAQLTPFLQSIPLHFIRRFNILPAIPIHGSAPYSAVAAQTGTDETHLRRLLRLAFAAGILDETEHGEVCHNASSALLLQNPFYLDIIGFMTEYVYKAGGSIVDAMGKDPQLQNPGGAGFNVAFGTNDNFLEFVSKRPEAAKFFGGTMEGMAKNPGFGHHHIVKGWQWESISGVVVDVGGSSGHTCVALAKAFPSLDFVIQDFPSAFEGVAEAMPDEVKARIRFMAHDFFTPQPRITGARVYLLRWILHDWPPAYCRKIIQNLTSGMEAGSSILIAEIINPPRGVLAWPEELYMAGQDVIMMALHNSQERTLEEYQTLVTGADGRLQYAQHTQPEGSILSFIEFVLV